MRFGDCVTNRQIELRNMIDPILNQTIRFKGPGLTQKECDMINTDEDIMTKATNWEDYTWIVSSTGEAKQIVPQSGSYYKYTEVEYSDKEMKQCRSGANIPSWYWILNPNTPWPRNL